MKKRLDALVTEYGPAVVVVYLTIFVLVLTGFALAIKAGFEVEGTAGNLGAWGAAYVATKVAQPFRIGATVLLTPLAVRLWRRTRGTMRSPPVEGDNTSPGG